MRARTIRMVMALAVAATAFLAAAPRAVADETKPDEAARAKGLEVPPGIEIDDATKALLEKIWSVGPYQVPDLGIRKDTLYAATPGELEPYGSVKPFKRFFLEQMEYTGPGRAIPEPEHVDTVKIGFIGPIVATVSAATGGRSHEEDLGIQMLKGCRLAIEEANARGGYLRRHIPFELDIKNDNGLWGASGNTIVDLAYKDKVWAILGTIDGANSHIAIRVALKAEILMMNSGDTDPTFIETNIPWVARVIGDDRQQGYLLVDYMYHKLGLEKVGIIRASNRYGRFGVREIRDGSRRLGHPIVQEMAYNLGSTDFSLHLDRLRKAGAQAIVHWGDAREGALILNQMRKMGMKQPFFTSDRAVSDEFVKIAGANAEGVIASYPWNPDRKDPKLDAFEQRFRARFGAEAGTYAAHAYDGMNMLIYAIQVAGLNRARIRDVIAYPSKPWPGVTGDIPLGAALDDLGDVYLAEYRDGAWHYRSREDLGLPPRPKEQDSLEASGPGDPVKKDPRPAPQRAAPVAPPVSGSAGARPATGKPEDPPRPYFDARTYHSEYAGPGEEDPEPPDPSEVKLAWFGPSDPADPVGGDLWSAAKLAVEEANRAGGYKGIPFRLVPIWSKNPWGTGIGELARAAWDDGIRAILGGVDGPTAHLAEQVVAKARLPFVNVASTDGTVNMANVAWTFSCMPPDSTQAGPLAGALLARSGERPYVLVSATDHDSRSFAREMLAALSRKGSAPGLRVEIDPVRTGAGADGRGSLSGHADKLEEQARTVASASPGAVAILAGPMETARFIRLLKAAGYDGPVLGGPA
ncbi:MAG TPA: ABC transporter substrate-binding protein, partial [Candidatus Saccharimonadales bacterium]|nr:ABC transporter substrate-binding protein [Candidatus Saccharimonadales bacterium]